MNNPEFQTHKLNPTGIQKADEISQWFDELLDNIKNYVPEGPNTGRFLALTKTQLELACQYARKGVSIQPGNQE